MMILVQDVTGVVAFPSSSQTLSLLFTNSQHAIICEFFNSFSFSVFNNTTFFINIIFPTNYISRGFLLNPSFQLTKWIQPQTFLL